MPRRVLASNVVVEKAMKPELTYLIPVYNDLESLHPYEDIELDQDGYWQVMLLWRKQ